MNLLLVDDHPLFSVGFAHALTHAGPGISVRCAATVAQGLELASAWPDLDIALIDYRLSGDDGLDGLRRFAARFPLVARVLISGSEEAHLAQQARAAGFTHYVACWREQSWGEHPLGRACDFAAAKNGFGGVATGSDRDYGNRLAGYLIANADRLGVLYVIWYHQIWTPGAGWHYYKGDGTPSGDHMNHVHLSER